jgi:transcriptional regulator with XRE-family HTH domain
VAEEESGGGSKTFAERLDLLFKATHPADRAEVSYQEVAEALANSGGPSVTPTYLYMLRTGRRSNPRAELIQALARHFKVPAGYFLDDDVAEEYGEQLRLLQAMRDSGTAGLALRAQGLSAESRAALTAILDRLRAADGLPAAQPEAPTGDISPGGEAPSGE